MKSLILFIAFMCPLVFYSCGASTADRYSDDEEKIKEKERRENGTAEKEKGLLDGVPAALPALTQAFEYQDRAARVGFDWPEVEGVLDKVRELRNLLPRMHLSIDGGIKEANLLQVAATGVNDICVGSAVFLQPDPGEAYRRLSKMVL